MRKHFLVLCILLLSSCNGSALLSSGTSSQDISSTETTSLSNSISSESISSEEELKSSYDPESSSSSDESSSSIIDEPSKDDYGYYSRYRNLDGYSAKVQKMMQMSSHVLKPADTDQSQLKKRKAITPGGDNVLNFDITTFDATKTSDKLASEGEFIVLSNIFVLQKRLLSLDELVSNNQYVYEDGYYEGYYLNNDELVYYTANVDFEGNVTGTNFLYIKDNEEGVFYYYIAYYDTFKLINISVPNEYLYIGSPTGQVYYDLTEKQYENNYHYVSQYTINDGNPADTINAMGQISLDLLKNVIDSQTKSEMTLSEYNEKIYAPYENELIDSSIVYYVTAAYQDEITKIEKIDDCFTDINIVYNDFNSKEHTISRNLYYLGNDDREEVITNYDYGHYGNLSFDNIEEHIRTRSIQVTPDDTFTATSYYIDLELCFDYTGQIRPIELLTNACEVNDTNKENIIKVLEYFARPYNEIKDNPAADLDAVIDSLTVKDSCTNGDELKSSVKQLIHSIIENNQ